MTFLWSGWTTSSWQLRHCWQRKTAEGGELGLTVSCDAADITVRLEGLNNQALRTVLIAPTRSSPARFAGWTYACS